MTEQVIATKPSIPRHKTLGGPLVMPPGPLPEPGNLACKRCGRKWNTRCTCRYYKRCTTYIDVLQDEFALKRWDRRQVAYGMASRKDLIAAAKACENDDSDEDKKELQRIADAAKEAAKGSHASNMGTALHKFTERLDTGRPTGVDDDVDLADIRAYKKATSDVEWLAVESFRVQDEYRVGGTTDRLGWYQGELYIFDLKTSPKDNAVSYPHGPAMQLAMYAHSVPYDIATDTRMVDPAPVNTEVAWIIALPAGSGRCRLVPINIGRGWRACGLARDVWNWRNTKNLILEDWQVENLRMPKTFAELAAAAPTLNELRRVWSLAYYANEITPEFFMVATARADVLKG